MAKSGELAEKVQALKEQLADLQREDPKLSNRFYLSHWLRASRHDVGRALQAIRANRKWRRENNIDALEYEDPDASFCRKFPYFYDVKGRDGRPVVYVQAALADPPSLVREFGREKTLRQMALALVKVEKAVYDWENEAKDDDEGAGSERACGSLYICDTEYLSVKKVVSIQAIKLYVEWTRMGVANFPNLGYQVHVINASRLIPFKVFNPLLSLRGVTIVTYSGVNGAGEKEYDEIYGVITPEQLQYLRTKAKLMFPEAVYES